VALAAGILLLAPGELTYLRNMIASEAGFAGWLFGMGLDSTLLFVLLLAGPLVWFWRTAPAEPDAAQSRWDAWFGPSTRPQGNDCRGGLLAWSLAIGVALLSIGVSASIADQRVGGQLNLRFGSLPPAYHDEYSYLFQAKTFLAGRLSFPSHETVPEIFDQMHVLNEGRFASRYFPGAGAWMAPFVALGHPYWGQWLAGALCALFTFWAGRELGGNGVGLLAGALTALSPGMGIFSNLLLAHHPTLAGLSFFVWMYFRLQRTGRTRDALLAGCGLAFAMLCRPMTAAGVALPFGVWQLGWIFWGTRPTDAAPASETLPDAARAERVSRGGFASRVKLSAALAAPLAAGMMLLFFYDRAVTGDGWTTPYQLYTDTYTPRHVYGFNNVTRGERHLGPKVIDNYDRWALNLTPELALRNTRDRLIAACQWTLSVPLLAMGSLAFLVLLPGRDRRWWLVPAGIVSLFAAHVPYWFVGIMNWHYVFESGPLWLLAFAGATGFALRGWRAQGRRGLCWWWGACIAVTVATTYTSLEPFHLRAAVEEVAFSRIRYEQFRQEVDRLVRPRPALILVEADPADRSIDYVTNDPDLRGDVLVGRFRPGATNVAQVMGAFPDRSCWLFRVKERQLLRLDRAAQKKSGLISLPK